MSTGHQGQEAIGLGRTGIEWGFQHSPFVSSLRSLLALPTLPRCPPTEELLGQHARSLASFPPRPDWPSSSILLPMTVGLIQSHAPRDSAAIPLYCPPKIVPSSPPPTSVSPNHTSLQVTSHTAISFIAASWTYTRVQPSQSEIGAGQSACGLWRLYCMCCGLGLGCARCADKNTR